MIKKTLKVLFFLFITFVFVFSSYELFFHKADAAWLTCNWGKVCSQSEEDCSVSSLTCTCQQILLQGGLQCALGINPEQQLILDF